ncbi:uncharacterized protein LOC126380199 [Pectinophora gossypiella]|uniref:uncharacterized protein LOC126380199 n=1 Tax=Pectinophora gossypiella TaxID=13191 RepID=UPI00214EEF6C|nr:uncharacterized protein LOC126380199 [Pectinophora gossypiella]
MPLDSISLFVDKFQVFLTSCILVLWLSTFIQSSKPLNKRQQAVWRIECELGVISDPDCPVDGGWTTWEPWSACHGSCDDAGHHHRTRQCVNPVPSDDGIPCSGPEEEIEPCYLTNCTVEDYRKLTEGDSTRMEAFHQLETVPALMERCLQIECRYSAIENALATDNTWQLDAEALWNSLQCVKHNVGCPVIGEWGSWGAWSSCGARCGRGLRWRLRRCDTPPPSNAQLVCTGTPLQAEECEGDQCASSSEVNTGGQWSTWSQWTACSEKCGIGVRHRRRSCLEKTISRPVGLWGTHCVGQHDEFEVCESNDCLLSGGWSGWGAWGPCSQSCGAGKRSRTRSCTRPVPSGGGKNCIGSKTEFMACYLSPCEAFTHVVVLLNGDSFLQYNFDKKRSTLFHFFVRFMPLSPRGTLVRRGAVHSPNVRLSLQKWHVCLDASGTSLSCTIPRICSPAVIEPAIWHTALVTVTSEAASLRMDDAIVPIRASFPCDPELLDNKMNILVGEKLHGEIQEMVLNFIPLKMVVERNRRTVRSEFFPTSASNVAFEKAAIEEAYLPLYNDQYLRLPCFNEQEEWRLELTIKSKRESGTILFLRDESTNSWLHMGLQNMRLKLKVSIEDLHSENSGSTECPPDQWLDVLLMKKQETNTIEASINGGERLHVVLEETAIKRREMSNKHIAPKNGQCEYKSDSFAICNDEFFVGGVPGENRAKTEEFTPFSGLIASISINNVLQDLHSFSVERCKDEKIQVSSRTASVSGSYQETAWGKSNRLNLTCLHARSTRSPHAAHWLYLDTTIGNIFKDKTVRSVDDGRVLRLVASADNDLRGFYTCRAHTNKRTRNIVTYGVIGKIRYNLSGPDTTTALAVITTVLLVVATLGWLFIEGVHDLRTGFGFFRDAHLTPEEEAEAVCSYIDNNIHLLSSPSVAEIAKARARLRGRQIALTSRSSFAAQEPQGLMQIENQPIKEIPLHLNITAEENSTSEPEDLPALPEEKTLNVSPTHDVYRCEQSYVSSPRHGSITSPRGRLSSSSSFELASPRFLCNRLLVARRIYSSRESLRSRIRKSPRYRNFDISHNIRSNLLTIKSSTFVNVSPAQKILQRFQQLRNDDY